MGDHTHYLNLPHVKKALGKPPSWSFDWLYRELNDAFEASGVVYKPTTGDLANILDERHVSDIRVLVLNGNLDFVINSAGQMWMYENLRWQGQAGYNLKQWRDVPTEMATTGSWKATEDGRLAFVAVDGAGHTVPGDVREGSFRIMKKWVAEGWNMAK